MLTSLAPVAIFYLCCATVSLIGNGIMIVCFFKERKFKSPCHYLVTLVCLADLLHLSGHYVFNFQLFFDITSSQELCFWMLFPTSIGLCLSSPLILAMGIDRFIACQSPMIYRNLLNIPKIYLLFLLFFPILYTFWLTSSAFIQRDDSFQVLCQVPLALSGTSFATFNMSAMFINGLVVIVYFLTFMKLRSFEKTGGTQMKVVFKSILYTVSFIIFGWSTVTICNTLAIKLVDDEKMVQLISIHAGIGLNMACASNVFVFYRINREYRDAIRRLFGKKDVVRLSSFSTTMRRSSTKIGI